MGDKLIYEKRGDIELRFGYNSFGNLSLIEYTNSGGTTSYYYVVCNSRGDDAASNGGNVWAGIGIGAAAGALIGTGVGMATGAALAGSITATTEAVMASGSALVGTVSVGATSATTTTALQSYYPPNNGFGDLLRNLHWMLEF
ncbi:MAG: hypothetical protein J1E81_07785 [Eubacterium sp.]|nr:hypothetical protein [Eubacterium sp.]